MRRCVIATIKQCLFQSVPSVWGENARGVALRILHCELFHVVSKRATHRFVLYVSPKTAKKCKKALDFLFHVIKNKLTFNIK